MQYPFQITICNIKLHIIKVKFVKLIVDKFIVDTESNYNNNECVDILHFKLH